MTALTITEKVIVVLRDGRKLIGVLRSYDQYGELVCLVERTDGPVQQGGGPTSDVQPLHPIHHCDMPPANLVLMDTVERLQAGNLYAEVPRGLYLIRGENVVLLGEIVRLASLTTVCVPSAKLTPPSF